MTDELARLMRRLANARNRVAYWSGRPSFRGFGFRPEHRNAGAADIEYEMALEDVNGIAEAIAVITGRKPKVTDYRKEFADRFNAALGSRKERTP